MTLQDARTAAEDARKEGLRGKYPAALIVMDLALIQALRQLECIDTSYVQGTFPGVAYAVRRAITALSSPTSEGG
jgi:hypothetical protein